MSLQRTATIITIIVGLVTLGVLGFTTLNDLTTVQNEPEVPPPIEFSGFVLAYANGVYYTGNGITFPGLSFPDFDTATVSGTIVFYVVVVGGSLDNAELVVYNSADTQVGIQAAVASNQGILNIYDAAYEVSYDTTQLVNGEYLFRVSGDLSDDTAPPGGGDPGTEDLMLSSFNLNWNSEDDTGTGFSGTDTTTEPGQDFEFTLEGVIPILGIAFIGLIAVLVVIYIWRR